MPVETETGTPTRQPTLGNTHTFAAGISYLAILTGTFPLFYFGVKFAGPGYWWSWPMVFLGQLMVALCFCELAARHPVADSAHTDSVHAGPVHNWARKLGGPHIGWLSGWLMVTATMVSLSTVALAYQITLPQISRFFQFVGPGTDKTDAAANAVLLGSVLILFTTLVNAFGARPMARVNSAGVLVELIAALTLIALLAAHLTHGPGVITRSAGHGSGGAGGIGESLGYVGALLTALLASAYVIYGFGTASSRDKESLDSSRSAPHAILRALVVSLLIGGLVVLFALLAVPDLNSTRLSADGIQFVLLSTLGPTVGEIVLWCVVIAITVCALTVHRAGIRLVFAMARDDCLPASSLLARVSPRFGTPVVAAITVGLVAVGILVINVNQPRIFSVITSIAILMIYLAYLTVTLPMLVQRLRGTWRPKPTSEEHFSSKGRFSLGRFGLPVNLLAVLWGIGMSVNLAWPRPEVHNAEAPFHWYPRWGVFLFVGIVAAGGFTYYWLVQRERTGVPGSGARQGHTHAHTRIRIRGNLMATYRSLLSTVRRRPTAGGAKTGRPPK
ncbi:MULTISPECIES: APC family permease [unclassified Streptomyces]|uniref:APC family permease n=1 Tax=unclassified Streptomyces TaxID=2593676 RepID=UPI00081DE3B3|nr:MULTISPECIES: APC family permease [unclassified Streptomyces]MYZ39305.1 amino acid permease [Streptomyces sp. SID4917]SCG03209.1 amino acid/polyamine/organocation transporter, APC superfamily [Streptomyces sp. MnatMP-M17]